MSYTSFMYLIMIGLLCIIYYIVPSKYRWVVLLGGNVVFYGASGLDNLVFLSLSILVTYGIANKMGKIQEEFNEIKKQGIYNRKELKEIRKTYTERKQRYLKVGLFVVIGILVVVKYTNFVLKNVYSLAGLLHIETEGMLVKLIVPMGISFYTFQMISYLVDVYNNNQEPQKNLLRYALYASFFPSVVQGPIPRYHNLGTQLEQEHPLEFDNIRDGVFLILWGLVKKLVLAERLNLFVNEIYGNYTSYQGVILVVATVFYSIQIYADFSGCMDIVTGTAKLFGIHLQQNFLRPYFSKTMPEFWRRWHASLGSWFKDYVFYPFSISTVCLKLNKNARQKFGNAAGRIIAAAVPILIVWSLTGIWHGAEWKYVVWGLFHGTLIILSTIFGPFNEKMRERFHIRKESFCFQLFQMGRTFFLCCVGRVFFRASSLKAALGVFRNMFAATGLWRLTNGNLYKYGLNERNMELVLIMMILLWFVSFLEERSGGETIEKIVGRQHGAIQWIVLYVLLFTVVIFGSYGPGYNAAAFIYEQF